MTPETLDLPRAAAPVPAQIPDDTAEFGSRARRWWVWLLVLALAAGLGYAAYRWWPFPARVAAPTGRSSDGRPVPVVASSARQGDMPIYLTGLGSVVPLNTVTVRSRVDGQLDKVGFTEGQIVKQGADLFTIDPRPFEAQVKQAQGQWQKDKAALDNAKAELAKDELAKEALPVQQIETQKALVGQYEGALNIDQGQIDNANLNLTYSKITAPFTGRIGLRMVDAGNMVHATDASGLAVITQIQPITVVFNLPQDDIPQVLKKMTPDATLEVDAYDRDLKNRLARGKLLAIDNQVDASSGTFRLKAVFPNEDGLLFPNQFVNARLLVETLHKVVIVPTAAVQRGPESTYAYVVKSDGSVELRNIVVGAAEADESVVQSGIAAGDVVVTDGVDKLQNGTKVSSRAPGAKGKGATTRPTGAGHGGAGTTRPSATLSDADAANSSESGSASGTHHRHSDAAPAGSAPVASDSASADSASTQPAASPVEQPASTEPAGTDPSSHSGRRRENR